FNDNCLTIISVCDRVDQHYMRMVRLIPPSVLLLAFVLFVGISRAADSLSVRYLGIEQGLSNNAVTCVYQDHSGFMWFGTYYGINRYDGYGFKVFRNVFGDTNSLAFNNISALEGDAGHRLWIGGENGLSVYDPVASVFTTPSFFPAI